MSPPEVGLDQIWYENTAPMDWIEFDTKTSITFLKFY